jgi:hypothetical protein
MVTAMSTEGRRSDQAPSTVTAPRRGWLDVLRDASDLALLGILTTVGALGVVTAGAAVATASAALREWLERGSWPTARETIHRYVRGLLPGVPVTLLAAGATALLTLNATAFAGGAVPGGRPAAGATLVLAAALAGYAALVVVEVGRAGGWRAAAGRAARAAQARPVLPVALAGATVVAAALAATVNPVAVPILVGYLLAAQHAVARRLAPVSPRRSARG